MRNKRLFTTSMMCADFFHLQSQMETINKHTDFYHIDIMDGHFVPNIALGFDFIKQLRQTTKKPIDVHLMVSDPLQYLDLLLEIGVDYISVHPKTVERSIFKIINTIEANDLKLGIVLSPSDSFESIRYYKKHVSKITIMTVEPGFAGQSVIEEVIEKIKEADIYRQENNLDYLIEVDGSNNFQTFEKYCKNGTDLFVLGSTLFKEKNLDASYQKIKNYIYSL